MSVTGERLLAPEQFDREMIASMTAFSTPVTRLIIRHRSR